MDVPNATYTNTIGASELIKVWKDPTSMPPNERSITCGCSKFPPRWTAYDAKYYGITMPPEVP